MSAYDSAIALVKRMVLKKGQIVTWIQSKDAPADASKPWLPTDAVDVTLTPSICFVPVKDKDTRKLIQALKGTEVTTGSLAGLMAAEGFEPCRKDVVVRKLDGKDRRLTVVSADLLAPGDQAVLWVLEFEEA